MSESWIDPYLRSNPAPAVLPGPPAPAPLPVPVEASPVEASPVEAPPPADPLDAELRALVAAGLSLRGIAARLDGRLHKSGVAKRLLRLGLSTTPAVGPRCPRCGQRLRRPRGGAAE